MRISDWSSDVCSSDLGLPMHVRCRLGLARSFQITTVLPGFTALENVAVAAQAHDGHSFRFLRPVAAESALNDAAMAALEQVGLGRRATVRASAPSPGETRPQTGRAACRERVCQYV